MNKFPGLGPVFPLTFGLTLRTLPGVPGLPILIAAALLALALVLSIRFARAVRLAPAVPG